MSTNEEFFAQRRAAAAFKHGLLKRYPKVFASKAGSLTSGRVVFLDGYAGPGRYDDGADGSPLLFVKAAQSMGELRNVTGLFVEQHPGRCERLREVLAGAAGSSDIQYRVFEGDLGAHIPVLLPQAVGAALFAFLDPFGTALDRDQLRSELLTRPGRAPTEVLLHFSVSTVARIGGLLRAASREGRDLDDQDRKTVANVDRFLGGSWWQESFRAVAGEEDLVTATDVALDVAERYCTTLGAETGFRSVLMPVRPAPMQAPKYVLVLFTRHADGVWEFASALGLAGREWQQAIFEAEQARAASTPYGMDTLFDVELDPFDPDRFERDRRDGWARGLAGRIQQLLDRHGDFRLIDRTVEVYGGLLGQAWERHVRKAVKDLYRAGFVTNDGKHDFYRFPVGPLRLPEQRNQDESTPRSASRPRSGRPAADRRPSAFDPPTA